MSKQSETDCLSPAPDKPACQAGWARPLPASTDGQVAGDAEHAMAVRSALAQLAASTAATSGLVPWLSKMRARVSCSYANGTRRTSLPEARGQGKSLLSKI